MALAAGASPRPLYCQRSFIDKQSLRNIPGIMLWGVCVCVRGEGGLVYSQAPAPCAPPRRRSSRGSPGNHKQTSQERICEKQLLNDVVKTPLLVWLRRCTPRSPQRARGPPCARGGGSASRGPPRPALAPPAQARCRSAPTRPLPPPPRRTLHYATPRHAPAAADCLRVMRIVRNLPETR